MSLTRRRLLQTTALIPAAALVACQSGSNAIPQWMLGLQAIANLALGALPELTAAGLAGSDADTASNILRNIVSTAAAISSASTATQGQSVLLQVEAYINSLVPIVAPFLPLIPGGGTLTLIIAALPAIEAALTIAVGVLSPQAKAVMAQVPSNAPAAGPVRPGMSPAEALDVLIERNALRAAAAGR